MTSALEPVSWNRRRWGGMIAFVFVVQLALIFWLGDRNPIHPRPPAHAPGLQLVDSSCADLLALSDPTLFALPHPEGFSGRAWLEIRDQHFEPFEWTEELRWLPLPVHELGAGLKRLVPNDPLNSWPTPNLPSPQIIPPEISSLDIADQHSALRMEGDLASRRLLTGFDLPSWPPRPLTATETDLLTNTIVQLVVDAEGRPVSVTLLSSSGLAAADEHALKQASAARFESLPLADPSAPDSVNAPLNHVRWGQLVFDWYTLPSTNPPVPAP